VKSVEYVKHTPDSFALLKSMKPKSFDVIITDPPFTDHVQSNLCSGSLVGTKNVPKYELEFASLNSVKWAADAIRVARRWVVIWCAVEDFGRFQDSYEEYVRGCIVYKSNAMGQLTGDRPATSYEGVTLLHTVANKKRWNGRGSYGIWKCNGTRGLKDRHPNEKPLNLCRKLVALFSERGEAILDPFAGSGAIGQAALELGRNYVGYDSDKTWVKKANARLKAKKWFDLTDEEALKLCHMNGPNDGSVRKELEEDDE
jgi:site-specific DNA-methyltransferase (adenine-specific)